MGSPFQYEPRAQQLLGLLRNLPRFDPSKKAKDLQGELPEVLAAERQFHSWNAAHQTKVEGEVVRSQVLLALFEQPEWKNFQRLLSHSRAGRERRKKANKRYREKQTPEQVYWACREKRRARLVGWLDTNNARLTDLLRVAHPMGGNTRFDPEVLNELEVRFVDEHRAELEYWRLLFVVVLEQHHQHRNQETLQRLKRAAQQIGQEVERELAESAE